MSTRQTTINFIKKHPAALRLAIRVMRRFHFLYEPLRKFFLLYKSLQPDAYYHAWASRNEDECFAESITDQDAPLISVVVPTFNTLQTHLLEMVFSVVNQHYGNWELLLVNASSDEGRKQAVRNCGEIDERIRIIEVGENRGIAGNTNAGLAEARGSYVAFLDHDDMLHACALHCAVDTIVKYKPDLIYTDEDKISHKGDLFFGPHCKPRWSPDLLRNVNYINHLTVIRTDCVKKVDGLRPAFDGAQDYDLLLRVIDICKPSIRHIAQVLYHWRAADSSTARDISNKQYIFDAGKRAIQQHLDRNKLAAKAKVIRGKPGFYRVEYNRLERFSIVIGPVEPRRRRVCAWWLKKVLAKTGTGDTELIIGDWYKEYAAELDVRPKIRWVKGGTDYWKEAAKLVSAQAVVCFQIMATPPSKDSLRDLAAVARHAQTLAVAPIIIGPDSTIIDAGFVEVDFGLQPLFAGCKLGQSTHFGSTDWTRNTMGLTMGVFAVRDDTFKELVEVMEGNVLTTFDLRDIYNKHVDDLSMSLLWAHTPVIYKGVLQATEIEDTYFNTRLTQASAPINMKVSPWGKFNERAPEE